MELNRENFRVMIFYDFRQGLTPQQCYDQLRLAFGNESPSSNSVYNWYREFRRGRHSFKDEPRGGRPKSAIVPETIDAVRKMIENNPNTTYLEIEQCLGIRAPSIHKILHEHLNVRKIRARK